MSDASSEMARDERRAQNYLDYLDCLIGYLQDSGKVPYEQVEEAAKSTDSVLGGSCGGRTGLQEGLKEKVEALKQGDKEEWAKLLYHLDNNEPQYQGLVDLSPFTGKTLLKASYRGAHLHLDLSSLNETITKRLDELNLKIKDSDDYLLVLGIPKEVIENAEVHWAHCGILGVKGPRDRKGNPKE